MNMSAEGYTMLASGTLALDTSIYLGMRDRRGGVRDMEGETSSLDRVPYSYQGI